VASKKKLPAKKAKSAKKAGKKRAKPQSPNSKKSKSSKKAQSSVKVQKPKKVSAPKRKIELIFLDEQPRRKDGRFRKLKKGERRTKKNHIRPATASLDVTSPKHEKIPGVFGPIVPIEVDVTSQAERFLDIHVKLREEAIKDKRFRIPTEEIRGVNRRHQKGFHQGKILGTYLTEASLEDILYNVEHHLVSVLSKSKVKNPLTYISFHTTQYGLEMFGTDKGEISRIDELSTNALHWAVNGTGGDRDVSGLMAKARDRLEEFLKKGVKTTVIIESVEVFVVYDEE
jgi:hypothetical protein